MNDAQAVDVVLAVMQLAVVIRDEGPAAVAAAARDVITAAGEDPIAALAVAAALVRVDAPIDIWWTPTRKRPGPKPQPHGTHAAFNRHKRLEQHPCESCEAGEREYQSGRKRVQRAEAVA